MNEIKLSGKVVQDAEVRFTSSGDAIIKFSLEISEPKSSYYGFEGERNWKYSVVKVQPTVEEQDIPKAGDQLSVIGKIYTRSWKVENEWKSKVEITAEQLTFGTDKNVSVEGGYKSPNADWPEEDLPF